MKPYLTLSTMDFYNVVGGTLQILERIRSDIKSDEKLKKCRMMSSKLVLRIGGRQRLYVFNAYIF